MFVNRCFIARSKSGAGLCTSHEVNAACQLYRDFSYPCGVSLYSLGSVPFHVRKDSLPPKKQEIANFEALSGGCVHRLLLHRQIQ